MIPKFCSRHDRDFIKQQLKRLPAHWRPQVVEHYSNKYREIFYSEPVESKRENLARKTANAWLIGYVKKYEQKYLQGDRNQS